MLVISRNKGESVLIGDDIEIMVVEAQDGKVRIGINAPRDVRILRRELLDEVKNANAEAAGADVSLQTLAQTLHVGRPRP